MSNLKEQLIKLGTQAPDLQAHIKPILHHLEAPASKVAAVGERIYLDEDQMAKFRLTGARGEEFIAAADAILRSKNPHVGYDRRHQELLKGLGGRTLVMKGQGYGWFVIESVT